MSAWSDFFKPLTLERRDRQLLMLWMERQIALPDLLARAHCHDSAYNMARRIMAWEGEDDADGAFAPLTPARPPMSGGARASPE
ncbi:MAG: hypothetical protein V4582_03585 [Pseudomonadota bacterium]